MHTSIKRRLSGFLRDTRGADTIEWLIVAALVGLGAIVAVTATGDSISGKFRNVSSSVGGINASPH
jgi:Flp pilus assembly pilin Flp